MFLLLTQGVLIHSKIGKTLTHLKLLATRASLTCISVSTTETFPVKYVTVYKLYFYKNDPKCLFLESSIKYSLLTLEIIQLHLKP